MTKYEKDDEKNRYIKIVVFNSANDIVSIESKVNHAVDLLKKAGAKIVSIQIHNFGISPMNMIYNIIYEYTHCLSDDELLGKEHHEPKQ